jgi:uncharacterized protein (TIGR03083 family)
MQAVQTRRFRGKNKAPKWTRPDDGIVSVMVLPLAVTDPADLDRLEKLFGAMWSIKRAVQRGARAKVDAYWSAQHERDCDGAKAVRQRLGLSREALERCAYRHLQDAGHLKHHATKALAMHMADEVWNGVSRHLFADNTGKRHGRPKVGRWHDFTRIPGRARSHTTANKWETFRLAGTLHGHVMAYTSGGQHTLQQPRRMPKPTLPTKTVPTGKTTASGKPGMRKATWWDHTGPLAVVFAAGPDSSRGDLVLPVRLPQQPGQWERVEHFLANPGRWHKVDLVRRRKTSAPGGWVYEAHLMILGPGCTAPAVQQMRQQAAALDRIGGVDGNVSNVSVVSLPAGLDPAEGRPESTEITLGPEERALLVLGRHHAVGRGVGGGWVGGKPTLHTSERPPADAELHSVPDAGPRRRMMAIGERGRRRPVTDNHDHDHDAVRELLAAWAFGALQPADEKAVPLHLAECESCAAEAERLRETVRLLDGPPGAAPTGDGPAGADGVLGVVLRTARPALPRVAAHAVPYAAAVAGLRALLREVGGDQRPWSTSVVHGWDVRDTVGHLIAADEQLAQRLGLAPHAPPSRITERTPWEEAWEARTADVIAYERTRTPEETVAAWSAQAAALLATPEARDPELAARATTLMGIRLPVADHFLVRAFEAWIHTDDIGRALGLAVPPPPDTHVWQLVRLAVRILGMALGPTAAPVLFTVTGAEGDVQWVLGSEDEPVRAELVLGAVDFCLLVGGRYAPDEVPRGAAGEEDVVRDVLERAAGLSWL